MTEKLNAQEKKKRPVSVEFLLTHNDFIIANRYFQVPDFNNDAKNSIELYDYVKYICNIIDNELKISNAEFLIENQKMFESVNYIDKTISDDDIGYIFELRIKQKPIIQRLIKSNYYHPKSRVDIIKYLTEFLNDLTEILSKKKLNTKYLNYQLSNA
jgi:hypothetical protein